MHHRASEFCFFFELSNCVYIQTILEMLIDVNNLYLIYPVYKCQDLQCILEFTFTEMPILLHTTQLYTKGVYFKPL